MSSRPSPQGAAKVLELLRSLETTGAALAQAEHDHARLSKLLPCLREEHARIHRGITEALDGMDVARNGNFGWEGRVVWFLAELAKQARSAGWAAAGPHVHIYLSGRCECGDVQQPANG
jgi:hypothetical protein